MQTTFEKIILWPALCVLISSCNPSLETTQAVPANQLNPTWTYKNTHGPDLRFLRIAYDVVNNESHKLGSACNRYLMRVLQIYGFNTGNGFVANDFDLYAKRHFEHYKTKKITSADDLKRLIDTYSERTAFILQWERSSGHGHVAILERQENNYYIYEASLNRYNPRIKKISLQSLFAPYRIGQLTVYTNFLD